MIDSSWIELSVEIGMIAKPLMFVGLLVLIAVYTIKLIKDTRKH